MAHGKIPHAWAFCSRELPLQENQHLAADYPQARHVHAWTAESNDAMRTINEEFGFRPVETTHTVDSA